MKTRFDKAKISGICVSVPEHKICIDDELESVFSNNIKTLKRMKKVIGLNTRYICDENTCVSDLGKHAANTLLQGLNIDKNSLDALIVVTQSPDFFMPSTACYLHQLLNLSSKTIAFDLGQACAGYLYGLFVAHSLIQSGLGKILLICGDTLSKFIHPKNMNLAPIFGDGVSATLIEKTDFNEAFFELGSDGR
ncbi:beta-ketoacyl-ACP synthase III, partial [Campylobacter jejuni]